MTVTLPLAPNGLFRSIQGEGSMLGVPMVFVRLAGCSVGCPKCDTDYSVAERLTIQEIADKVMELGAPLKHKWVWVTGGEPTDHEWVWGLTEKLKCLGFFAAIATAGVRRCPESFERTGATFLSVSPHDPAKWVQRRGNELKLIPGLNGFGLKDFDFINPMPIAFGEKFVMPCEGLPETIEECRKFVEENPGWKMTCQAHKQWSMP